MTFNLILSFKIISLEQTFPLPKKKPTLADLIQRLSKVNLSNRVKSQLPNTEPNSDDSDDSDYVRIVNLESSGENTDSSGNEHYNPSHCFNRRHRRRRR